MHPHLTVIALHPRLLNLLIIFLLDQVRLAGVLQDRAGGEGEQEGGVKVRRGESEQGMEVSEAEGECDLWFEDQGFRTGLKKYKAQRCRILSKF